MTTYCYIFGDIKINVWLHLLKNFFSITTQEVPYGIIAYHDKTYKVKDKDLAENERL